MAIDTCLVTTLSSDHPNVLQIKEFLGCELNPKETSLFSFQFHLTDSQLWLSDQQGRKLEIDFDKNHLDYQRQHHRGKNELIAKALGLQKGLKKVLDLSSGMGIDAIFLGQLGFEVVSFERSKHLFTLLNFAQNHSEKIKSLKVQFKYGDSLEITRDIEFLSQFDCVYFDPMYPHKKKSALPKQEMVIFRDLVGDDQDAKVVLEQVLKNGVKRAVVKRPVHAEELCPGVKHQFEGKTVRFDLYF